MNVASLLTIVAPAAAADSLTPPAPGFAALLTNGAPAGKAGPAILPAPSGEKAAPASEQPDVVESGEETPVLAEAAAGIALPEAAPVPVKVAVAEPAAAIAPAPAKPAGPAAAKPGMAKVDGPPVGAEGVVDAVDGAASDTETVAEPAEVETRHADARPKDAAPPLPPLQPGHAIAEQTVDLPVTTVPMAAPPPSAQEPTLAEGEQPADITPPRAKIEVVQTPADHPMTAAQGDAVSPSETSASLLQAQPGPAAKGATFAETYAAHRLPQHEAAPVIPAQPGRIGHEIGVEIARHVAAGRDEVLVRLDPPEMGRIEVRLSFGHEGGLRAVVAADSPAALDLLRRDASDLNRALADAGVRTDSQSFRFDSRAGDSGASWQRGQQAQGQQQRGGEGFAGERAEDQPLYRPLRASGRIDLMA